MSFAEFLYTPYGSGCINEFPGTPSDWFRGGNGEDLVNYIGTVETLFSDMQTILEINNLPSISPGDLGHLNKSQRTQYREYYNDRMRSAVADRFRYEIERFGYTF
jgi:hypothetical protein